MKSEWKVEKNIINGVEMYRAYRVIDVTQVNHSGNRVYIGKWFSRKEIKMLFWDAKDVIEEDQEDVIEEDQEDVIEEDQEDVMEEDQEND
jgi:hypothetical protein